VLIAGAGTTAIDQQRRVGLAVLQQRQLDAGRGVAALQVVGLLLLLLLLLFLRVVAQRKDGATLVAEAGRATAVGAGL